VAVAQMVITFSFIELENTCTLPCAQQPSTVKYLTHLNQSVYRRLLL